MTLQEPMGRRAFIKALSGVVAFPTAWLADGVGGDESNPMTTPRPEDLAARYGSLLQEKGLKRQPGTDHVYPTSYGEILYDWELYFDCLALLYYGLHKPASDGLRMFLQTQRDDGFICRRILRDAAQSGWGLLEAEEHCKPFLCQIALLVSRVRGDASWLSADDVARLERYLDHWLTACDMDRNGLSEWGSGPHSGADTQLNRVGTWRSRYCEGVDLNCYLHREFQAASEVAKSLGKNELAAKFTQEAERKLQCLQDRWDEQDSFFYDRDRRTGQAIKVRSAACFLTLWAGVATKEQARQLVVRHLTNPQEFWTPLPLPSYARSEPAYSQRYEPPAGADVLYALPAGHCNWCGGMWPHWNYLIVHGLEEYGFHEEARDIASKWLLAASNPSGLYEWYNAETGKGEGLNPFWAGSSILGIMLPTELEYRVNPTMVNAVNTRLELREVQNALRIVTSN